MTAPRASDGSSLRETLDALVDDLLVRRPAAASLLGLRRYDALPPRLAADEIARAEQADREWLSRLEGISAAGQAHDDVVDLTLARGWLRHSVATAPFQLWRRSVEPYLADGVYELLIHGTRDDDELVDAVTARLSAIPDTVAAAMSNLEPDLVDPTLLDRDRKTVLAQAEYVEGDVAAAVADTTRRGPVQDAAGSAAEAYRRLAAHMDDIAHRATGSFVFGEANYAAVLNHRAGLDQSVADLCAMGEAELTRLTDAMNEIAAQLGDGPTWLTSVRRLQLVHAADEAGMMADYANATHRARAFVTEHELITMPAGEECQLLPSPEFERESLAVASYLEPPRFGGPLTGRFFIPYCRRGAAADEIEERLRSNARFEIPATAVHEAYPGHHVQLTRAQRAPLARQVMESTYLIEGWALYAEQMMADQGFYRDPEEVLGQLSGRLLRAARVVVDTRLHTGEMSLDQATTFMRQRAGLPESVARSEVLRYAGWPTQASAYLTGAMMIEAGRDRWLATGRPLRAFHDALTELGSLPPGLALGALTA